MKRAKWLKLRIRCKLYRFTDSIEKKKSAWSNVFGYLDINLFWKFIQFSRHWVKNTNATKISSGQYKRCKKNIFFILRALITHHGFIFNSGLLYELKYGGCLSKCVCCGFYFFDFASYTKI